MYLSQKKKKKKKNQCVSKLFKGPAEKKWSFMKSVFDKKKKKSFYFFLFFYFNNNAGPDPGVGKRGTCPPPPPPEATASHTLPPVFFDITRLCISYPDTCDFQKQEVHKW